MTAEPGTGVHETLARCLARLTEHFAYVPAVHPGVDAAGVAAREWARGHGLTAAATDPAYRTAAFEGLPARMLPDVPQHRLDLMTQWVIYLFVLDDLQDEGAMGRHRGELDRFYGRLYEMLHPVPNAKAPGGHAELTPLEGALGDLWRRTADSMSALWCHRFFTHMRRHHFAFQEEVAHRHARTLPSSETVRRLRRGSNGMFMFDLVEPVLGLEIPDGLFRGAPWTTVFEGVCDITAWCNDLVSYERDRAQGESTNLVMTSAHDFALGARGALDYVTDLIVARTTEVRAAQQAVLAQCRAPGADPAALHAVTQVGRTLLLTIGAHLDWVTVSGRYADAVRAAPRPRR